LIFLSQKSIFFGQFLFCSQNSPNFGFPIVELRVLSNHGHQLYTCLYRFRVHGTPMDTVDSTWAKFFVQLYFLGRFRAFFAGVFVCLSKKVMLQRKIFHCCKNKISHAIFSGFALYYNMKIDGSIGNLYSNNYASM